MPGAVWAYLKERHMFDAVPVQNLILSSYVADMTKYASPAETTRIMACFDRIVQDKTRMNRMGILKYGASCPRALFIRSNRPPGKGATAQTVIAEILGKVPVSSV